MNVIELSKGVQSRKLTKEDRRKLLSIFERYPSSYLFYSKEDLIRCNSKLVSKIDYIIFPYLLSQNKFYHRGELVTLHKQTLTNLIIIRNGKKENVPKLSVFNQMLESYQSLENRFYAYFGFRG